MSVTQIKQSVGSWNVRLRGNIPRKVINALTPFGHVAIVPGSVNVAEYGDALLTSARYVGVYRTKDDQQNGMVLSGVGLESWLGDENGAGDVFESPLVFNAATFAAAIAGSLPSGGSITAGTINSVAGTYTGTHQWVTSRKVLDYITSIFDAEWRINPNGTIDAGTVAQLYSTTPKAILFARDDSSDLRYKALPGSATMKKESGDYTTRVVVLGEGEGDTISVGSADAGVVPYKDLHGNQVKMTRVFSESFTVPTNANVRASILLQQYGQTFIPTVNLSTSDYDIKGNVQVGDYIYVYNPPAGFEDTANEETWNGEIIHPVKLRVVELSWPIRKGWTVAFRDAEGVWTDLSPYVFYETGDTNIIVGDLPRSLSESIGFRPNLPPGPGSDVTIPGVPAFTAWSFGAYQAADMSTTKAVIHVTWSTPLNVDSSTITDGAYYEIRYRVSEVVGYKVMWGAVHNLYRWGQLAGNRWGAPLSAPVSADPEWIYLQVGWGTNQASILELTPGVTYEFQIRAVDAAYPPHFGNFSTSSFQTTTGDLFAPSTPAAPTSVAKGPLTIQVKHDLGKASGGTYNLEADLVRLNVHVGGSPSFYADATNQVGELAANIGMISKGIAAVGTFPIPQIETIYVKVVAVDRFGNKSSASPATTTTANLIDDQYISSLSVSKLTAGTITANSILAGLIDVGTGGTVAITQGSFQVKDAFGRVIVRMGLLPDGKYGIRVDDASGNPQVRMGELLSGGYGMEAVDETGALVSLSTLAFGTEAKFAFGSQYVNSGSFVVDQDGLKVVSRVGTSRRAIVILSSQIAHSLSAGSQVRNGTMNVRITNLSTGEITMTPNSTYELHADVGGNTGDAGVPFLPSSQKTSCALLVEGSTYFPSAPADYSFDVFYTASVGEVYFQNRSIMVIPF